jgi:hypothetical protein
MLNKIDKWKLVKLQWVQNATQTYVYTMNNVRREISKTIKKKKEHLKEKLNELETVSKNKKHQTYIDE